MKAVKRNCKVPFLIGGYFCSGRHGEFNSLYFTLVLISRALSTLPSAYRPHTLSPVHKRRALAGARESRKESKTPGGGGGGMRTRLRLWRAGGRGRKRSETRWTFMWCAAIKRKAYYTVPRNKISALISFQQSGATGCRERSRQQPRWRGVNFCN